MDGCARIDARAVAGRAPEATFLAVLAVLFTVSSGTTIAWCTSMSAMGGMSMPGGWAMSMTWMRMPGQTWLGTAGTFLGMWLVMMVAMMLPSLLPMLLRYRRAIGSKRAARSGRLTVQVAAAYFLVWTVLGLAIYPLGVLLAAAEMQHASLARAVPLAAAATVLIAGLLQFSPWKARHLRYCRQVAHCGAGARTESGSAFGHGLLLGLHCCYCCANLTAILLVTGVMDLRAMAVVTAAITVERLAPAGERAARAMGVVIVGTGVLLLAQSLSVH